MKSLTEIPVGKRVKIYRLESQPEVCHRLRELGFCENAVIRCVTSSSSQLICEVCNSRVGLHHSIAKDIVVTSFE